MNFTSLGRGHDGVAVRPVLRYVVIYDDFLPNGRVIRQVYEETTLDKAITRFKRYQKLLHLGGWKIRYTPSDGLFTCWKWRKKKGEMLTRRLGFRASTLMGDTSKPTW